MAIGDPIEYTIMFPQASQERPDLRLRCMGKVTRMESLSEEQADFNPAKPYNVAVTLERYEFIRKS